MMNIEIYEFFKNSFVLTIDNVRFELFKKVFKYHKLDVPKKYCGFSFKKFQLKNKKEAIIDPILNCSYGHASIIKLAQYLNLPFVCIFEDDAYPCYDIKKKLEYYLQDIPDDCECLILGNNGNIKNCVCINDKFIKMQSFGPGTHAYIIFRKVYDKILSSYNEKIAISDMVFQDLICYSPHFNLFIQYCDKNVSSIHDNLKEYIWFGRNMEQVFKEFPKIETILSNVYE